MEPSVGLSPTHSMCCKAPPASIAAKPQLGGDLIRSVIQGASVLGAATRHSSSRWSVPGSASYKGPTKPHTSYFASSPRRPRRPRSRRCSCATLPRALLLPRLCAVFVRTCDSSTAEPWSARRPSATTQVSSARSFGQQQSPRRRERLSSTARALTISTGSEFGFLTACFD